MRHDKPYKSNYTGYCNATAGHQGGDDEKNPYDDGCIDSQVPRLSLSQPHCI